jgi:hypothetical protein
MTLFTDDFHPCLGSHAQRALKIFRDYGPNLSCDLAFIFSNALSQEERKIEVILDLLECHYRSVLVRQNLEFRGSAIENGFLERTNPTRAIIRAICRDILGLDWSEQEPPG